jgi:hypothetical protein
MTAVMAGCSSAAVIILILGRRAILYRCKPQDVEEQSYELIERY